jgi:hypothetical protein
VDKQPAKLTAPEAGLNGGFRVNLDSWIDNGARDRLCTLGLAGVIYSWLTIGCLDLFVPLSRRFKISGGLAILGLIIAIISLSAPRIENFTPAPPIVRSPVPCGYEPDMEFLDGLCYLKPRRPLKF